MCVCLYDVILEQNIYDNNSMCFKSMKVFLRNSLKCMNNNNYNNIFITLNKTRVNLGLAQQCEN